MRLLSIEKAAQQCGLDLSTLHPDTIEFTCAVATRLASIHAADREAALNNVVEALRVGGQDAPKRVLRALFLEGVAA